MSSISTVTVRGQKRYRAHYRTPDGVSRSKTFDTKRDATNFLTTVESSKLQGAYVDQAAGRVTFRTYAERWRALQPHRPATEVGVEHILRLHVYPVLGDMPLRSIKVSDIQAFVTGLSAEPRPLAPSTIVTVYGKVAGILRAAVDDQLIARSPCTRAIRLPRPEGGEVVPMAPEDVATMMGAVGERYRALIVFLAGSGVRPGEALGLTVDRVDFLRRTVRIDRQLVTTSGKKAPDVPAGKRGKRTASPVEFGPCKTPSSVRTIPVPQAVLDELAAHLARFGEGPERLIFTDDKGDPIRRNALGHQWRRAAEKVGIVDRSPHDLRHYAASVLIREGASVKAVQKHLGHASATTTLDTYAHLWPDAEETTRSALEQGLVGIVIPATEARAATP